MNHWEDDAIALNARMVSENDAILEVFTRNHGRVSAYVYGGASKRKRASLQSGQALNIAWKTRTEGQIGYFDRLETISSIAPILSDKAGICALSSICSLLHLAIPEQLAYIQLFEATNILIEAIKTDDDWPAAYIGWEVGLLTHAGFGLDLSKCALSGSLDNLYWVSPKTGHAASYEAGLPYKDKLLKLPQFLLSSQIKVEIGDIADGFALTGWFLERDLLRQNYKELPESRARLIYALGKANLL